MTGLGSDSWWGDVLSRRDSAQEEYSLLGPGNAYYPGAAARMSAFVSDTDWLLTVQLLAWGAPRG